MNQREATDAYMKTIHDLQKENTDLRKRIADALSPDGVERGLIGYWGFQTITHKQKMLEALRAALGEEVTG